MDSYPIIERWRRRPAAVAVLLGCLVAAVTGCLVAVGGPPSPVTDLYYLAVILAGMLWAAWPAAAVRALAGVLVDPVARALLGHPVVVGNGWALRCVVLMVVGWVCGILTRSLLHRVGQRKTLT
jgi:hypothetical protein